MHLYCTYIVDALGKQSIVAMTAREFRQWRDQLTDELAPATVNRTANALNAASNLAAENDERITCRRAWEAGLTSIKDAEDPRNVIVPEGDIRTIIAKAGEESAESRC